MHETQADRQDSAGDGGMESKTKLSVSGGWFAFVALSLLLILLLLSGWEKEGSFLLKRGTGMGLWALLLPIGWLRGWLKAPEHSALSFHFTDTAWPLWQTWSLHCGLDGQAGLGSGRNRQTDRDRHEREPNEAEAYASSTSLTHPLSSPPPPLPPLSPPSSPLHHYSIM